MVVVATTVPCAFVERRAFGVFVIARLLVVAKVEVSVVAESAVVDAYGNCEAATVDEEKKTP